MNGNFDHEKGMYNSSSIGDYMLCPRYFYWAWMRRLQRKGTLGAVNFGSAFHAAMKCWYKGEGEEKALKCFEGLPTVLEGDTRTRGWGESLFKMYIERYPLEKEVGKTLHLEVIFRIIIGSRIYAGTIDRIEKWEGIYVDDHKTTSRLGSTFFDNYRPNPQMDGYCYACREIVGDCNGVVINGISVAANPKERFMRNISSRSKEEIDDWVEVFTDTTDMMVQSIDKKHFPKHTCNCNKYGKCRFWELCVYFNKDEERREKFIEANYEVRKDEQVEVKGE